MKLTVRQMQSHEEYASCVDLQRETWGQNFAEIVPPTVLMVAQKIGGLAAGAFDDNNCMVGFVFGQSGFMNGRLMNWSQMLAVKRELRGKGIGRKLKLYQRDFLLERGIEFVYWTYDPLVARNAHINLNKLGANICAYVEDMYPADNGSDLHRGMSLDRFIVEWPIASEHVELAISGQLKEQNEKRGKTPVTNTELDEIDQPIPVDKELPPDPKVRVEVPLNIEAIQAQSLEIAERWRANTRRVFVWYLDKNYKVANFYRERHRCFYVLVSNPSK